MITKACIAVMAGYGRSRDRIILRVAASLSGVERQAQHRGVLQFYLLYAKSCALGVTSSGRGLSA